MRIKRLATGRYQVRWRDDGTQRAKNFRTKELAQDFCRSLDRGETVAERRSGEPTFRAFAHRWLTEIRHLHRSPTTRRSDESTIESYLLPALGHLRLSEMKKADFVSLQGQLVARGLKPQTVNWILKLARALLWQAVDLGVMRENPCHRVKPLPEDAKATNAWTIEERERFLRFCKAADPAFAELVLVACHTGLRMGELQALERYQLNFEERLILVDASYSSKAKLRVKRTKTGAIGYVPMNEPVYQTLRDRQLMATTEPVFDPGLFVDAYDRLQRRAQKAGVKQIRFHDLRHTYATTLKRAKRDQFEVQRLMRHKTGAMTQRYMHLDVEDLREACASIVHSSPEIASK
jgi:integrase